MQNICFDLYKTVDRHSSQPGCGCIVARLEVCTCIQTAIKCILTDW